MPEKPTVTLIGEDGNAFIIIGKVSKALKKAGYGQDYIDQYTYEATSGDYNHLLATTMKYVEVT
jgi:hypothetical protein